MLNISCVLPDVKRNRKEKKKRKTKPLGLKLFVIVWEGLEWYFDLIEFHPTFVGPTAYLVICLRR